MKEEIIGIITRVTKLNAEMLNMYSSEPRQWDSMNHIEIVLLIEEEFDIRFTQEEMAEMNSVDAICKTVERMV